MHCEACGRASPPPPREKLRIHWPEGTKVWVQCERYTDTERMSGTDVGCGSKVRPRGTLTEGPREAVITLHGANLHPRTPPRGPWPSHYHQTTAQKHCKTLTSSFRKRSRKAEEFFAWQKTYGWIEAVRARPWLSKYFDDFACGAIALAELCWHPRENAIAHPTDHEHP